MYPSRFRQVIGQAAFDLEVQCNYDYFDMHDLAMQGAGAGLPRLKRVMSSRRVGTGHAIGVTVIPSYAHGDCRSTIGGGKLQEVVYFSRVIQPACCELVPEIRASSTYATDVH
jgi:hypothetical protein